MKWTRAVAVCSIVLMLGACASGAKPSACQPAERLAITDTLYFGTVAPAGVVSPEEWQDFFSGTVMPRFPQGVTSWEASSQWHTPTGALQRERSRVLYLVHAGTEENEGAVRDIVARYKARFQQESVLRVRSRACVSS